MIRRKSGIGTGTKAWPAAYCSFWPAFTGFHPTNQSEKIRSVSLLTEFHSSPFDPFLNRPRIDPPSPTLSSGRLPIRGFGAISSS